MADERDRAVWAEDQTKQMMAQLEQSLRDAEQAKLKAEAGERARQRAWARQLLSDTELMRVSTAIPNRREQGLKRLRQAAELDPTAAMRARLRDEVKRLRATELAVVDDPTARLVASPRGAGAGEGRPPQAGGVRGRRDGPRKPSLDEMGPGPDKESKPYRPGPRSTTGRAGMRGGWRPRGR